MRVAKWHRSRDGKLSESCCQLALTTSRANVQVVHVSFVVFENPTNFLPGDYQTHGCVAALTLSSHFNHSCAICAISLIFTMIHNLRNRKEVQAAVETFHPQNYQNYLYFLSNYLIVFYAIDSSTMLFMDGHDILNLSLRLNTCFKHTCACT